MRHQVSTRSEKDRSEGLNFPPGPSKPALDSRIPIVREESALDDVDNKIENDLA